MADASANPANNPIQMDSGLYAVERTESLVTLTNPGLYQV